MRCFFLFMSNYKPVEPEIQFSIKLNRYNGVKLLRDGTSPFLSPTKPRPCETAISG